MIGTVSISQALLLFLYLTRFFTIFKIQPPTIKVLNCSLYFWSSVSSILTLYSICTLWTRVCYFNQILVFWVLYWTSYCRIYNLLPKTHLKLYFGIATPPNFGARPHLLTCLGSFIGKEFSSLVVTFLRPVCFSNRFFCAIFEEQPKLLFVTSHLLLKL